MFVLLANLCLMAVGVVGMYGVCMRVQFQQKRIRHHGSGKEQEQQNGDIAGKSIHLIQLGFYKYSNIRYIVMFIGPLLTDLQL